FGDSLTERQRDAMVRAVYVHFCTMLIEILTMPRRLHPCNWKKHVALQGGDRIVAALMSGRPLLFVTGHFGNWEMAGYALGLFGFWTHAIAGPIDNPHVDRFLRAFRERTGQHILAKSGEFDRIQDVLASGGVLATLADQDAGQRGLFVEFFGRPASTHKAIALLALEYGVTLAVALVRNTGQPLSYCVHVEDIICAEEYVQRPDVVRAITQRFT